MPISTPYNFPIVSETTRCAQEPDISYTPYDLFALRTQLLPYLQDIIGHDVDIQLPTTPIQGRMVVMVVPIIGGDYIQITKDQEQRCQQRVNEITTNNPKMLMLYTWKNQTALEDGSPIPTNFVKQILPYIRLDPSKYTDKFSQIGESFGRVSTNQMADPYYNGQRGANLPPELQTSNKYPSIHLTLSTYGLYCNLSEYDLLYNGKEATQLPSYLEIYNYLALEVERQIRNFYRAGAILGADEIAQQWSLSSIDDLWIPTWSDRRFADDLQAFISSRLMGDKDVRVRILKEKQWQIQHWIAVQYPNVIFENLTAIIDVETLEEARIFADVVDEITASNLQNVEVTITNIDDRSIHQDSVVYFMDNLQVVSRII